MYTLPTAALKLFASNSSFIQQHGILPILDFIRMEFKGRTCIIHKTNLKNYYIQVINLDIAMGDAVFLIDEKTLFNFVSQCGYDNITLTPASKTINITDGSTKVKCPSAEHVQFPALPVLDNPIGIKMSTDMVADLRRASKFIIDEEMPQLTGFIFVGNGYISACDRFTAFFKAAAREYDNMVINKSVVDAIGKECRYFTSGNYNAFETQDGIYLFVKPDFKFFDLTNINKIPEDKSCAIDKNELISFLALAKSSCKSKICVVDLTLTGNNLFCKMDDIDYDINVEREVDVDGFEDFTFRSNVDYMLKLLKTVAGNQLIIYAQSDRLVFTDIDKTFTSLIMRVVDAPTK